MAEGLAAVEAGIAAAVGLPYRPERTVRARVVLDDRHRGSRAGPDHGGGERGHESDADKGDPG